MQNQCISPYNPQANYCLTLNSSSSAKADGIDTNSAVATLSAYGKPLCGCNITFCLSGNAVFCDGSRYYRVVTDHRGQATVYFTDRRQESVIVNCRFESKSALSYSTFCPSIDISELFIVVFVERNDAPAGNKERNAIVYTLLDSYTATPVSGRLMKFTILNGLATLDEESGVTDYYGQTRVTLRSDTPNTVTVVASAVLNDQEVINNYTEVRFSPPVTYITCRKNC